MAKRIKNEDNSFVDEVSGIKYQWLKEETTPANGISCWSAKDQWGQKDYFVVKEGLIIKGPFRTIKETCKALEEGFEPEEEVGEVDVEERADAGIADALRQATNQVTELIRKCEELMQWVNEEGKDELAVVLNDIVNVENENIGKIQAMLGRVTNSDEHIEDGKEQAEQAMDDVQGVDEVEEVEEEEEDIFEDLGSINLRNLFGITPMPTITMDDDGSTKVVESAPTIAPTVPNVGNGENADVLRQRFDLPVGGFDDDIIGFDE